MRDFFLNQLHFEARGVWPFDQRAHGLPGMIESYSDLLSVGNDEDIVADTLAYLRLAETKGHWHCPCGSGAPLRRCCRARLAALREKWSLAGVERLWSHYHKLKRALKSDGKEHQFSKA